MTKANLMTDSKTNTTNKTKILLVEDNAANAIVYKSYLENNYSLELAIDGRSALEQIDSHSFAAILLDVQLPDMSGLDILKHIRKQGNDTPVVVITAHGSVDIALDAMQAGANDFLSKPFDKARIEVTLAKILKEAKLTQMVSQYEKSCTRQSFYKMIGESLPMQSVYNIIENSATSKATVFITGESGTGKELCAEAIHAKSQRADMPFIAINCAAIPRDLLESEIFGHIKGAFTGAASSREGAAAMANQGTLFLDEIGEMPMELQSKLLRFVQTGCYQAVGSSKEVYVDVRFVCATNRDPLEEIKQGRFREDLYYRLHVIPIHMPPLRERGDDCVMIAKDMLTKYTAEENKSFKKFSNKVENIFSSYQWPGNVRELSNVIRNTVVLNDASSVEPDMLPSPINQIESNKSLSRKMNNNVRQYAVTNELIIEENLNNNQQQELNNRPELNTQEINLQQVMPNIEKDSHISFTIEPLWLSEKRIIEKAIDACQGNIPKAAAFLEISASTVYRKKQSWDER